MHMCCLCRIIPCYMYCVKNNQTGIVCQNCCKCHVAHTMQLRQTNCMEETVQENIYREVLP